MKISNDGIKTLAKWEGAVREGDIHLPYDDKTGKPISEWCEGATIGYGHLIHTEEMYERFANGIIEEEAIAILGDDVQSASLICEKVIEKKIEQHQFDACVIFAFNIGTNGFRSSSALKWINGKGSETNFSSLESAWKAWNKQTIDGKKVVVNGLINRRNNEWILYNEGRYA